MLTVVEVILVKSTRERLRLLRINNKKKCKSYDGYITIETKVKGGYDDRL